jgi:hypothetical protein
MARASDRPTFTPTAPAQLAITIVPDRDGKATILVSLRGADGTQPPRKLVVDLNGRLGAFVAAAQALVRPQLTPIESPTQRGARGGDPAIAVEAAHGK